MAQPPATAKRVKTAETDWPLRPHQQEQRQNRVNVFVSFVSSSNTGTNPNVGICSTTVSIPFDVRAIEIDAVSSSDGVAVVPIIIGIQELAGYFGKQLHALTPNVGASLGSSHHEFARPVPMQGQRLTFDLYQANGTENVVAPFTDATSVPVVVRLSFLRNTK